jgi:hypothetical protein
VCGREPHTMATRFVFLGLSARDSAAPYSVLALLAPDGPFGSGGRFARQNAVVGPDPDSLRYGLLATGIFWQSEHFPDKTTTRPPGTP